MLNRLKPVVPNRSGPLYLVTTYYPMSDKNVPLSACYYTVNLVHAHNLTLHYPR